MDYIVVSVCSTIIDNLEPITDQPCWALFVRQEQPEIYTIPHQQLVSSAHKLDSNLFLGVLSKFDLMVHYYFAIRSSQIFSMFNAAKSGSNRFIFYHSKAHSNKTEHFRKLLGQKIWEILIPPGDDQEELVNVIKDGKRNRVRIKTKINKNVLMDIRPVINPHSKLPEFIIGHLTEVHEYHQ